MHQTQEQPVAGIFWMVLTGVFFVGVTATVKHVGGNLPVVQTAFLRFLFGLIFVAPGIIALFRNPVSSRALRFAALRGVAHSISVYLWFLAMTLITIGEVTSLNYLTPVYVTIGAALFLGERLALRRIAAVFVALAGAIVILRPGIREITQGHIAILGASVFLAMSYLMAKRLAGEIDPAQNVALMTLSVTILLAPVAILSWEAPSASELAWTVLIAAFASAGHYTMSKAFAVASVAVTQPVTFLQLVWAILAGWVLFDEAIDAWVIFGGTVIVAAISYIAWREFVLHRREPTPSAG